MQNLFTKDIEKFKHTLTIAAFEHQIIFSRLHEKRVEIIADLYSSLKDVLFKAQDFSSLFDDGIKDKKRDEFSKTVNEFYIKFEKNKIWLEETLCNKITEIYKELISPAKEMILADIISREDSSSVRKKYTTWFESHNKYQKDVPEAISLLENEFRKELGVVKIHQIGV